jgi:hypothetical protein
VTAFQPTGGGRVMRPPGPLAVGASLGPTSGNRRPDAKPLARLEGSDERHAPDLDVGRVLEARRRLCEFRQRGQDELLHALSISSTWPTGRRRLPRSDFRQPTS